MSRSPSSSDYPQCSYGSTSLPSGSFWGKQTAGVRTTTLAFQLHMLKTTGRYDAFKLKWHPSYDDPPTHWPVPNHLFWDSDVAKWIEGAVYSLAVSEDAAVENAVEELVDMIRGAQQEDGYLNIHFTVVAPEQRWTNVRDLHEMYNAGHLIEAAIAHHNHFGNRRLLDPIVKYVDHIDRKFGPEDGKLHGYPGHPEIELALLRLYGITRDEKHLRLAKYFLIERGNLTGQDGKHFYDWEMKQRGDRENEVPRYYPEKGSYWYQQALTPITQQQTIEGHSVRAMYLYTAVADLVRLDSTLSEEYQVALKRLWRNMVEQKMYETGGIGAVKQWEGFGIDYLLPQATDEGGCYAETCASIGIMMMAERMLAIDPDGDYADAMELALYNTILGSKSLDGKAFTYVNQLASCPNDPSKRDEWFECACCPPNVTRLFATLGGYIWSWREQSPDRIEVTVHLHTAATLRIPTSHGEVVLEQITNYPWDGKVSYRVTAPTEVTVVIKSRIPKWTTIPEKQPYPVVGRKYILEGASEFEVNFDLTPRFVRPHPFTGRDTIAVARGPVVYCVEDADHSWVDDHFKTTYLDPVVSLVEENHTDASTGEAFVRIKSPGGGALLDVDGTMQRTKDTFKERKDLVFVPFYFRGNRGGKGMLRVGLRRLAE